MLFRRLPANRVARLVTAIVLLAALTRVSFAWADSQAAQLANAFDVRVNQTKSADQQEPTLSVDPNNPNNILAAAKDWRTGPKQVWDYRSTDGGSTWTDGYPNLLPSELPNQSDPVIAFDTSSSAYLAELGYNQSDFSVGGVFVSRTSDMGASWQPAVLVSANSQTVFNDKEWLTVDRSPNQATRDSVYVTWTLFTTVSPTRETAQIVISRSTDGGKTFSSRQPITPADQPMVQGSFPAVGPNGELYVLYYSGPGALDSERNEGEEGASGAAYQALQTSQPGTGTSELYVVKSTDGGRTFGQPALVASIVRPPSPLPNSAFRIFVLPTLTVDPVSGAVYAVWNDARAGHTDVLLSASRDGGTSWSNPKRVTDDPASATTDHFFPTATVGKDGTLQLLWLDRRDDPANLLYRPYYTRSTDGGKTFSADEPLSAAQSDPNVGFEGTLIGDYVSLDTSGDGKRFYAVWPDTRNGNQDIYFTSMDTASPAPPKPLPTVTTVGTPVAAPSPQPLTGFSDGAFITAWEGADRPVLTGHTQRPWVWGPASFAAANEPYKEGQNGLREVLYFDKARMEINNPHLDPASPGYVTNGLLVVEMVSGRIQLGINDFAPPKPPPTVPIAGDVDSPDAITYASLVPVASLNNDNRAPDLTGQYVTAVLSKEGTLTDDPSKANLVKLVKYEPTLGHNIPDVFWTFMNAQGPIYNGRFGTYANGLILDWVSALGYPITEPYWTNVKIGGVPKSVLVQAFQRRVLTYVADNPPGWQVEMANAGRHYFDWRYGGFAR
jgi:hypothetical protein